MDGKHLKDLRRQLNLSQAELAGPEVTRNLISMIENGRTPLTLKTADLLAQQINRQLSARREFIPMTAEDLAEPGRYQVRREIRSLLETIDEYRQEPHFTLSTYLARLASLFSQWDLPQEKTEAYSLVARCFEADGRNQEAHLYFSRAYENAARCAEPARLAEVTLNLTRTALKLGHGYSAILAADALRSYEGRIPDQLLLEVFLNQAAAYMTEGDYDSALGSLIFSEHLLAGEAAVWNTRVLTLKLDCYISKGMFGIATRIFSALEQQAPDLVGHEAEALSIVLACLRSRMNPGSIGSFDFSEHWRRFSAAPAAYPHPELLFLHLMEASLREAPALFGEIAWRALTDIPPQMHPTPCRNVISLILRTWEEHAEMDLNLHWRLLLKRSELRAVPGFEGLLLGFLSHLAAADRSELLQEGLRLWRTAP